MNIINQPLLKLAWAEIRNEKGKWVFAFLAVLTATFALSVVNILRTSLETSIASQAQNLMGADFRLRRNSSLSDSAAGGLRTQLRNQAAAEAQVVRFDSMIRLLQPQPGQVPSRLIKVQAIQGQYPFYGQFEVEPKEAYQQLTEAKQDVIIIDAEAMQLMELKLGDKVEMGGLPFTIIGTYKQSLDAPNIGFSLGQPVFVPLASVQKTQLLAFGSRVRYNYFYKLQNPGQAEQLKEQFWDQASDSNVTLYTSKESSDGLRRLFGGVIKFLQLAGFITVLLSAVGMAAAMHVVVKQKVKHVAILKSQGIRQWDLISAYFLIAVLVAIAGSAAGLGAGILIPLLFEQSLATSLPIALELFFSPAALMPPVLLSILVCLLFTLWPVYGLSRVSPMQVIKSGDYGSANGKITAGFFVLGFISVILVILLTGELLDSLELSLYFFGVTGLAIAAIALISWGILYGMGRLYPKLGFLPYRLRQGLANLYRPGNQTVLMISAVGIGTLLIVLLLIMEASLGAGFQVSSSDRPNIFLVDVTADQKQPIKTWLKENGAERVQFEPKISARIASINGNVIDRTKMERNAVRRDWQERSRNREYIISYRSQLYESENIIDGQFWTMESLQQNPYQASVSERWADNMNIDVGDKLGLTVAGVPVDVTITSIRSVNWMTLEPNSIIVISPTALPGVKSVYYASMKLTDSSQKLAFKQFLAGQYLNITIVDTEEAAKKFEAVTGQILVALQVMSLITWFTGLLLVVSSLVSGRTARMGESTLLKVLGAIRTDILRILLSEYAFLAAFGLLLGVGLGLGTGYILTDLIFRLGAAIPWAAILITTSVVLTAIVIIGWSVSREVIAAKPMDVLRRVA